jgi:HK97 family phage prohead protease
MQINRVYWPVELLPFIGERRAASAARPTDMPAAMPAVKSAGVSTKAFPFICSSARADRMGDVIRQEGWDLSEFKRNPVALYAHNSSAFPVGVWRGMRVEAGKLRGEVTFAATDQAQQARQLVEGHVLKACSVGFVPGEWSWLDKNKPGGGIKFESGHQLLEVSLCPIGANADALAQMALTAAAPGSSARRRARQLELLRLRCGP